MAKDVTLADIAAKVGVIVSIVFRKFSFILNRLNCNVPVKPLHVKGACTELALDAAREHRYHQAGGK